MKKRKIINFIIKLFFAVAIISFILYIRYLLKLKSVSNLNSLKLVSAYVTRYRNITVFSILVGMILLFIKTFIDFLMINKIEVVKNEKVLDKISTRNLNNEIVLPVENNKVVKKVVEEDNEKIEINDTKIINSILNDKVLKVKFYGDEINEKLVKFSHYDKDNNSLELVDISKSKNEEIRQEQKKVIIFNPIKFVLNIICILLIFIIILLFITKIDERYNINKNNLNIKTVETK